MTMKPYAPKGDIVWHPEKSRAGRSDNKNQVRYGRKMKPLLKGKRRMADKEGVRKEKWDAEAACSHEAFELREAAIAWVDNMRRDDSSVEAVSGDDKRGMKVDTRLRNAAEVFANRKKRKRA